MGNGIELYKNQLEVYKRSIENLKKEIAHYRDVLKQNPKFTASQKNSYKIMIESKQRDIKVRQDMMAACKKNLATAIEIEKEKKKREQEKKKKANEKAREEKKKQQETDKKRKQEEAKKAAVVSRASSSSTTSIIASVVSASSAASLLNSAAYDTTTSTCTRSEPSYSRMETMSSYSTKSEGAASCINNSKKQSKIRSSRKWIVTLILCLFFGVFGAHRFYVGKIGTGILQLFTVGGYFIWTCLDLANILNGEFTDSEGKVIRK